MGPRQTTKAIRQIIADREKKAAPYYPEGVPISKVLLRCLQMAEEFDFLSPTEVIEGLNYVWAEGWTEDDLTAADLVHTMVGEAEARAREAKARAALKRREESRLASRFSLESALKAAIGG